MATSLLISYPDIPLRATMTVSGAASSGYTAFDTITGPRELIYKTDSSAASFNFDYDLGVGVTASANHLIVARANLISGHESSGTPTVTLKADTSAAYANTIQAATNVSTANFYGPQSNDMIMTFSASTAYRYWRFLVTAGTSIDFCPVSKIYFGTGFDMGRDPEYARTLQRDVMRNGNREGRYIVIAKWEGITDAKAQSFISTIAQYRDIHPVFLYTTSYHDILNELKVIHCYLKIYRITQRKRPNNNTIMCTFEECI